MNAKPSTPAVLTVAVGIWVAAALAGAGIAWAVDSVWRCVAHR